MAEKDNVPLDTSVFVKQLSSVCEKTGNNNNSSNSSNSKSSSSSNSKNCSNSSSSNSSNHALSKLGSSGGSTDRAGATSRCSLFSNKGGRRHVALLHNSASYELRGSSSYHRYSVGRGVYSRSLDDAIVSRYTAWRQQHALSSRQGTYSDEPEEDSEVRNASMESLYSSSDRDSDVEAMSNTYCEPSTSSRRARLSRQREQGELRRPLLRQALLGSSTFNNSIGDTDYGSCSNRSSLITVLPAHFIPCTASMGDLDKLDSDSSESGTEMLTPAKIQAQRRSMSLLNLTPPGRAVYYVPDSALPDASPARPPSTEMFLDDTLLDGNLADILFSVEALWPKK